LARAPGHPFYEELAEPNGKRGPAIEPTMTVERMVQDGVEVAEFLTEHLNKKKIIIYGSSWARSLGIYMAHARPDLF
jgi:hypothetical protein